MIPRWIRFNAVGLAGVVVQLAVLALARDGLGWNYLVATAVAVEAAVLHNFVWHERWTWRERTGGGIKGRLGRLVRFHLSNGLVSIVGNLLLMRLFTGVLGWHYLVANLLAIAICSVVNFLAADRLVFRPASSSLPAERARP